MTVSHFSPAELLPLSRIISSPEKISNDFKSPVTFKNTEKDLFFRFILHLNNKFVGTKVL